MLLVRKFFILIQTTTTTLTKISENMELSDVRDNFVSFKSAYSHGQMIEKRWRGEYFQVHVRYQWRVGSEDQGARAPLRRVFRGRQSTIGTLAVKLERL